MKRTSLNVLCYAEPSFYLNSGSDHPDLNISTFFGQYVYNGLSLTEGFEIRTVIPASVGHRNRETHALDQLNPIDVSADELFTIFTQAHSLMEIYKAIYHSRCTETEKVEFAKLIRTKIGNWTPDLIITYPIQNDILKEIYPHALCLQMEYGIFSRYPAPPSIKLDPVHFTNAFARQFKQQINSIQITDAQRGAILKFVGELGTIFLPSKKTILKLNEYRKRFKHIVLLPIPANNTVNESDWNDQVAFLRWIMQNIPKDIAVLLTFHDTVSSQINARTIKYFQTLYPNLIYFPPDPHAISSAASLIFFSQCDAVLNCCSMTGIQAVVFGTRLVAIDKSYSHAYADHIGLDGLEKFLDSPKPDNLSKIFWLLTRGTVFDRQLQPRQQETPYFAQLVQSYRDHGIGFDLFPETESIESITNYILDVIRFNIKVAKITRHVPDFILKIERTIKTAIRKG